jgi:hypothetical protein
MGHNRAMHIRPAVLILGLALIAAGTTASAQSVVYRCPGPPVLYTDALTPKEAQDKGCRSIEGTPITVLQPMRPRPAAPTSAAGTGGATQTPASAPRTTEGRSEARVDPAQQRSRDGERRRVLETELREAEERLAALQRDFSAGAPERRGDERNYQRYLDRVAEIKAAISRQENDIQALKREISKLP